MDNPGPGERAGAVDADLVMLAPGLYAQREASVFGVVSGFDVTVEVVALPMSDGRAGRFACRSITVAQLNGGPMVTSVGLRSVAVGRMVYDGVGDMLDTLGSDGRPGGLAQISADDVAAMRAAPTSAATLSTVAAIYQRALVLGGAPAAAVQTFFDLSPRTAGRWIAAARRGAHLAPLETEPEEEE